MSHYTIGWKAANHTPASPRRLWGVIGGILIANLLYGAVVTSAVAQFTN